MKNKAAILAYVLSVFSILLVWQLCYVKINSTLILASPTQVFTKIIQLVSSLKFWKGFCFTFLRIMTAFLVSLVPGFLIGYGSATNSFVKKYFEPLLTILRVTPVIALILIVVFWFKSAVVPVFVAVLMVLPVIESAVETGFSADIKSELFMAKTYHFSKAKVFYYIRLPTAASSIKEGILSGFGLCWKVVVAGEVLCLPKTGLGTQLQKASLHLESSEVLAVTVILVLICYILQKLGEYVFRNK